MLYIREYERHSKWHEPNMLARRAGAVKPRLPPFLRIHEHRWYTSGVTRLYWPQFGILFAAALLGGLAILPYSLRLLNASGQSDAIKLPVPRLLLLSFLQTAVLSAIAIGVGLLAAQAMGLGAPYIEAALARNGSIKGIEQMLRPAIGLGVLGGVVILLMDLLFLPYWPSRLRDMARKTTTWENITASFYGGLNEEFLMRLFGLSVLLWLLSRIWHTPTGRPTNAVFWSANVMMAIVFGLGHLPAAYGLLGTVSPLMLARTLLLNAPIGLITGWLFWTYGIEAAVLAHFSTDIVYHVVGTLILRHHLSTST